MNMIFKVVLLACLYNVCGAKPLTPEEGKAMFLEILNNCKVAEGASEDDAMGIMTHSIPTTAAGSCLNYCVMEKTGIVQDGKFSVEGALQISAMSGDPQKPKNVAAIGPDCVSIVAADRCELGKKILECLHKGSAAIGINSATDLM